MNAVGINAMELNQRLRITVKIKYWLRRYWLADVLGSLGMWLGVSTAAYMGANVITIAIVGSWCEFASYYTPLLVREYRLQRQSKQRAAAIWRALRNLLLEFGPAELFDTSLIRPALLTAAMQLLPTMLSAIVVGVLASDFVYYTIVITSYELRRKLLSGDKASTR